MKLSECCSVFYRVAVCCSAVEVCCSEFVAEKNDYETMAVLLEVSHCVAVCYSVLQCVAACCSVLQRVAACCSVLQRHGEE